MTRTEWQPSTESQKKEYLLLKRPERGLLAGMWELPSCDLDTESESAERLTALQAVLKKAVSTPVKLANHRELDTVIHKFSHITRSYKPIHVSVISKQRPELHLSKSKAVWLDAESVLSSNIPGAIKTVFTHFLNSGATKGGKKRKAPGGKSSKLVDKSQKSLSGFFVKRQDGKKTEQSVSSKVETSQESVSPSKARKVRVIADSDED